MESERAFIGFGLQTKSQPVNYYSEYQRTSMR